MEPESRQLKHFSVAAHSRTLTEAAEKLCITQPALSMSLKNLEDALELKLFSRSGRKLTLTTEGEIILEQAEKVLDDLSALTRTAERLRAVTSLRVAFCDPGPYWYFAPRIGAAGLEPAPEMQLLPDDCTPEKLTAGEFDVVISAKPFASTAQPGDAGDKEDAVSPFSSEVLVRDQTILSIPRNRPDFCRANGFEPDAVVGPQQSLCIKDLRGLDLVFLKLKGVFSQQKAAMHETLHKSVAFEEFTDYFLFRHALKGRNAATITTALDLHFRDDGSERLLIPMRDEASMITYYMNWLKHPLRNSSRAAATALEQFLSVMRAFAAEFKQPSKP